MNSLPWSRCALGEIAEFVNGGAWSQDEYSEQGIRVVRVSDIKNGTVDLTASKFLSPSAEKKYRKHRLRAGDLIVCTVGSHPTQPLSVVGRAITAPKSVEGALLNQNAVLIRPSTEDLDAAWLGFLGRSKPFHDFIVGRARGAASQVRIPIGILKEMPVQLPPISAQRRIASILTAYDDLIKNNARRISILEEMAQRIYEEWFVRFRFPCHENVRMVESELGPVPKGWELHAVSDFGKIVTGKTPSKAKPEYFGSDVPFIKTPDMHDRMFVLATGESLSSIGAKSQSGKTIPPNTLCVSCIGTIGVVAIATEPSQTNQQINSIVLARDEMLEFLFFYLKGSKKTLENLGANGATMGNVNKTKFESLTVLTPCEALIQEYHRLGAPIFRLTDRLLRKNQNLRETRDLLLPKLISGELDLASLPEPKAAVA